METITLNNGVQMPHMGFGTIGQSGAQITDNVAFALNHGYDLIDTANRYGNEVDVGLGLKQSGRTRDGYFLETKLGPTLYENKRAIDDTLVRLGVDHIDLMLLHHPVNNWLHAYGMLEKAYRAGKLRAIGVSNFSVAQLQELLAACEVRPAVMQVEGHPYWPAEAVRGFCREQGIALQTWYPLGHGDRSLTGEPLFAELGAKYGRSPVQVILRWHIQMGFCPVPGSRSPAHIAANAEVFDFALSDDDMARIALLNRHAPIFRVTPEVLQRLATTKCNFVD